MYDPYDQNSWPFEVGDKVQKKIGYKWPGVIVSRFYTLDKKLRYVVECTVSEVQGALHIYSHEQLRKI